MQKFIPSFPKPTGSSILRCIGKISLIGLCSTSGAFVLQANESAERSQASERATLSAEVSSDQFQLLEQKMLADLSKEALIYIPSGPLFRVEASIENRDLQIAVNRRMSSDTYSLNLDSLVIRETISKYRTPPLERQLKRNDSEYNEVVSHMTALVDEYLVPQAPAAENIKSYLEYVLLTPE